MCENVLRGNVWNNLGQMNLGSSQNKDPAGLEKGRDHDYGPPVHGGGTGEVLFACS